MPGHRCCVCPSQRESRTKSSLDKKSLSYLKKASLKTRVCARHFPEGNAKNPPSMTIGKRFASPKKKGHRADRARHRDEQKQFGELSRSTSKSVTPSPSCTPVPRSDRPSVTPLGEQLESDFELHELPTIAGASESRPSGDEMLVNAALLSRIRTLEAENARLISEKSKKTYFRIDDIKNDKLVRFYTGFISYAVFLSFLKFLGPVVNHLHFWGYKEGIRVRRRARKLNPENQLFLALVKLKLNLKLTDLAFRFGLSKSQVSRYLTTWICFLYQHLKEIEWMPIVRQVFGTLPTSFRDKFPTTFAIVEASEIFIETPTDLHLQSSTWSEYKHHSTAKFLVACTPNGAICFVSPVYGGCTSDVELTRVCGFLETLKDKPGISIMGDRGFMIKDMLKELNIDLNLPPFLEGRTQLPAEEVDKGRRIASLRIHVERAIGRRRHSAS